MNTSRKFLSRSLWIGAVAVSILAGCQQEIISQNPKSRSEGMKAYEAGEYAEAAGSFRNALRSDPRDYKSQYFLAMSYENLHQYQQAITAFKASLDAQTRTLAGRDDQAQRVTTINALASCIAKTDKNDAEINIIETQAKSGNQPQEWLLLGKVCEYRGDADSALDAYNRAYLLNPKDFLVAKQYGLYLEQVGQTQKAASTLKKAYTINQKDEQVNEALRRLAIVPGPSLKEESQLAKPHIPEGPLPEVDLSKFKIGSSEPAPAQPSAPSYTPPPPPAAAPPHAQERAVSAPHD